MRWWTNDGTALSGQDYVAAAGSVLFEPGETSKPIEVETLEDDNTEAVEVFYVSLDPPSIRTSAAMSGAVGANGDARSAYIACSVRFPQRSPIVFVREGRVPAGTVIDTVAAETTPGIPYYELGGGDKDKFAINSLTAEISTAVALDPDLYDLEVTVHDECGAQASVDVNVRVTQPNRAPVVASSIDNLTLHVGEGTSEKKIDLSKVFSDPDGDDLKYEAASSKTAVATAVVTGETLTVTAKGQGETTVTVTAKDPDGLKVTDEFNVKVPNRAPKPKGTIPPDTVEVKKSGTVDVSSYFTDQDGDRLKYAASSSDPSAVTVAVTGSTVTYTGKSVGSETVTVTADDGHGGKATQTFPVTVEPPPAPPEVDHPIDDVTLHVGEGATRKAINLLNVFSDPNGDDLDYTPVSSDPDVATAVLGGTTLTVAATGQGQATVSVTATDPGGLSVADTFLVEVPNRKPKVASPIANQTLYVGEGTSEKEFNLANVFSDPDGDRLGYTVVSADTDVATAVVNGTTLTVTASGQGRTRVVVTAKDPGGLAVADTFYVTVPNRRPKVAGPMADQTLYVGDGPNKKQFDLTNVFRDPDGDRLGYTPVSSDPDVATVALSGTTLTVTARGKGDATVRVTARDPDGLVVADTFEVTVPNRRPTPVGKIPDDAVDVGLGGSVNVKRYFRDPDGDGLTYKSASSDTDALKVNASGNPVRFTGEAAGRSTVTVTARDGGGLTATQSFDVSVYVQTVDCKITVSEAELSVAEDAAVGTALTGEVGVKASSDCGTLSYSLSGTGSGDFSVAAAGSSDDDGKVRVAKALDYETKASYALKLKVSWGSVSHTADVDISVKDVNEAPRVASAIPARTVEKGKTVSVAVTSHFSDPDGDKLTYTAKSSDTSVATVSESSGTVSVKGVSKGGADVTVTAADPGGKSVSQSFRVTVTEPDPANRAPVFGSAAYSRSVAENSSAGTNVGAPVTATDADKDDLTYGFAASSSLFAIGSGTGQIQVAAGASLDHESATRHVVSVVASDGALADTAAVTILVTDVPPPGKPAKPTVTGGAGSVAAAWQAPANTGPAITGYDVRYRSTAATDWARKSVGVVLSYTVTGLKASAKYEVQVRAVSSEGAGAWSDSGEATTEAVPNRAPSFGSVASSRSVAENSAAGTNVGDPVTATDADEDDLTYGFAASSSLFAIGSSSGQITVATGAVLDHESDTQHVVSVVASDGTLADTAKVTIGVTDVPPPGKPAKPAVTGGSRRVVVSWSAPANTGPAITGYDVRHRAASAAEWTRKSTGVVLSHTVTGLKASTKYEVQVRASSSEGAGAWSDSGEATTEAVPNRAPSFGSVASSRSVAENSAAGTNVGDPVTATDADEDDLTYGFTASSSLFAIGSSSGQITVATGAVLDHESDTQHVVSVVASDGTLADTAKVTIRVTDVPPPGKPAKPAVTGGPGSLSATWLAPANTGPAITGYVVRYRIKTATGWTTKSVGVVLSHTVTGLSGTTAYELQVRAVSSEGAGEWSASGEATTEAVPNRAPSFGSAAYERKVAENAAAGTNVGAPVTATDADKDDLTYGFAASSSLFAIGSSSGRITVASGAVLDHESDTQHVVSVVASDGTLADTAKVTIGVTDVPPPGQPAKPAVTGGFGSVKAVWLAPANTGPAITGYDVRYRITTATEWSEASVGVVLSHTVTELKSGTAYVVQVRAVSSEGAGAWSESGEAATTSNRPPAFADRTFTREVAENTAPGESVGDPVTAADADKDPLKYKLTSYGEGSLFRIDSETGQVTVGAETDLDYEGRLKFYTVEVVASDGALADSALVYIDVTDVPPPGKPAAPAVKGGTGRIAVSWSAPANKGPEITGYDLRHRVKGSGTWSDAAAVGKALAHTVTGLDAGTAYEAQVRASSSEGAGEWSDSGEGATAAANRAPSFGSAAYERKVAENSPGGTAVGEPVTAADADGDTLSYSFLSGGDEALFDIGSGVGGITVAEGATLDYESDSLHVVRVVASDGSLADTASVTIRVTDVPAPGQPDAPMAAGGVKEVAVSWSAPENKGPAITGYQLRYMARDDTEWSEIVKLGAVLAHTITGLDAATAYSVQVRAESTEGAGAWSESGEGTTAANRAPAFDAAAYERKVPENSAGGTAVGDAVTATDADGDTLTYSFVSGGDESSFEIDKETGQIGVAADAALDYESDNKLYTVTVEASDGALAHTASVTIRVTDVPAPGQPDAPAVTGGAGEVAVSWSAPSNEGPAITGYELRHMARGGTEWSGVVKLEAVLSHTIEGLAKATAYLVQVRAESPEGAGAWSDSGEGTTAANRAPAFGAAAYEREVPENSPGGTAVGDPVTASDADGDELTYSFASGGDEFPFEIDAKTGVIAVAENAALNYESPDSVYTVTVGASDGALAGTASVTIRVTNADDPGTVTLSPETARVDVELTATLMDEDKSKSVGKTRRWQRSDDDRSSWTDIAGATSRTYTPVEADAGKWLRAVFTYADGHGPDKRAESAAVEVEGVNAAPSFPVEYEREVPENSPGGTKVGNPVAATDPDSTALDYAFVGGGDALPFEIDTGTGQITVAGDAVLNHESADSVYAVKVEASDGALADTATVKIRVTNEDDPGTVALSPAVARVGVELNAALTDEDGVQGGRRRRWQRSRNGNSGWRDIGTARMYNPVTSDEGKWLRVVFSYTDGHGPDKRAVSAAVRVKGVNKAPVFGADGFEREVPENSDAGTRVGAPVTATDANGDTLTYRIVAGANADGAPFEIGEATGRITVAGGAALNHESADTVFTLTVEASDGELADTASVTIRVTDADDPGVVTLSPAVARVGVEMTVALKDEDGVRGGRKRQWQRSRTGNSAWRDVGTARMYNPVTSDEGKYLRVVFTYTDGHGAGKRAESAAVRVVGATTPVVSFGAEEYTAVPDGSADVEVRVSPVATAALAIKVEAGDATHTVTFQAGEGTGTVSIGAAGLAASDTLAIGFGTLPEGVAVGVPAATRIVVAAAAASRAARAAADGDAPAELAVEYAETAYTAIAGGPGTAVTLRIGPAADRRVAVPVTAVRLGSGTFEAEAAFIPDPVVFEPGDSLATFTLDIPAGTAPGRVALGFGALPEAVSAGTAASATVDIAAGDTDALLDEAFDVGLAVFGRAVAEGARQAVGARFDAVMQPERAATAPGSASGWAGRAAGTLASLAGVPLNPSSAADLANRSGSVALPSAGEAVRRLLPSVSFATGVGPQSREGRSRLGLWAEGSAQSFRGEPGTRYDGGLRALTVGADARVGSSALLGVSLMRSDGDLDYTRRSVDGSLGHAMNSVHPYLFLRPSPGIGLWAMAGYGSGDVDDENRTHDSGATLRMLSGGVKVPLARSGAFGLTLAGDAFTVGMRAENDRREGSASRARALLEASWTAGGLKLATQAGARYDGGDADTGAGAETGASVGYAGGGLDLDLRGRLALGSGGHREWGAALRLAFDPGTRGEGFRLAVSPVHGHDRNGIHGLMDGHALQGVAPGGHQVREWRLDAEAGYAMRGAGNGGALDGYTRLSAGARGRALSVGTGYRVGQTVRLGLEGSRTMVPGQPHTLGIRLGVDLVF